MALELSAFSTRDATNVTFLFQQFTTVHLVYDQLDPVNTFCTTLPNPTNPSSSPCSPLLRRRQHPLFLGCLPGSSLFRYAFSRLSHAAQPHEVQSLLHGSPEAKKDGDLEVQQHSRLVGRGKYVHGFTSTSLLLCIFAPYGPNYTLCSSPSQTREDYRVQEGCVSQVSVIFVFTR